MFEPYQNFPEGTDPAYIRKYLVDKIAEMEADLHEAKTVHDNKKIALKAAQTKERDASSTVWHIQANLNNAARQLRTLLPQPDGEELMDMAGLLRGVEETQSKDSTRG